MLVEVAAELDFSPRRSARPGVPIEPIFRANDEAVLLIEPESRAA